MCVVHAEADGCIDENFKQLNCQVPGPKSPPGGSMGETT